MIVQEKVIGRSQMLELVESAAQIAVQTYGLKIWGLDIVGGAGASARPVVRVFVDTPWEGKHIPFIMPETRAEKSRKKTAHPKQKNAQKNTQNNELLHSQNHTALVDIINDENGEDISYDMTDDMSNGMSENISTDETCSPITNAESVDINQCAHISRMIGLALEVEDAFADAWILEVSSPGLERQFYEVNQLSTYLGHPLDVTLIDPHTDFENRRKFRGTLKSVESNTFTLILDTPANTECVILWENVKKAHLVHIFPDAQFKS